VHEQRQLVQNRSRTHLHESRSAAVQGVGRDADDGAAGTAGHPSRHTI
jgi:hypothetical protein